MPTFVDRKANANVAPISAIRIPTTTIEPPRGGRFKLAIVVVRSAQKPTFPERVVYISGGPWRLPQRSY